MPLKTLVKVGNISNLSDARYCAGMGVDMLGFNAVEGSPNFVSPALFQQIRGWVTGPKIIAEVYGLKSDALPFVLENYAPDLLESSLSEYHELKARTSLSFIVHVSVDEIRSLKKDERVAYYLLDDFSSGVTNIELPLLIKVDSKETAQIVVESSNAKGISLNGSAEIRPGFKNYDELADILELLEQE